MPHFKPAPLLAMAIVVCVGAATIFIVGAGLLPAFAAPLPQFPTNSVTVISDPPPPDLPGQFSEVTLLQSGGSGFLDPHPNWRLPTFDDSSWLPSFPVVTLPAWGQPVNEPPPTDFIWGGPPGPAGPAGRFNILNTGTNQQYLFVRKNFCIPINANFNSIGVVNPARFEIAATPGNAEITFNGANVVTSLAGDETGFVYNLNLTTPVNLARRVGRNTLTLRVRDSEADTSAGVAYNVQFNYTIDPNAITITSNPPSPSNVNTPITFSQNNTGLSGDGPFSFDWNFGDGTTSTAASPSKTYTAPGLYTVVLTMTDRFGCPSAPVSLPYAVLEPTPTPVPPSPKGIEEEDEDEDEAPTPTPTPLPPPPTLTPLPSPTPGGPLYLPETGILDRPLVVNLTRSINHLATGDTLILGMGGLLFLLVGSYLIRRRFSGRD